MYVCGLNNIIFTIRSCQNRYEYIENSEKTYSGVVTFV